MGDDAIDELYEARPEDFTALRTELAASARKAGDTDAAKAIAAARKPTTAAWVVNALCHRDAQVKKRLGDLGARLRDAHGAMDGEQIRALSTEQRKLVDQFVRAAFDAAGVANPSAAVRDDVSGTLQASVADPDVLARLGRLERAEKWSGFGEFGSAAAVFTSDRVSKKAAAKPPAKKQKDDGAERRVRDEAKAAVAAAEKAKAQADDEVAERQSDLATARLRHDDARKRLAAAEEGLADAEQRYERAKEASRDAGAAVKEAKSRFSRER